MKSLRKKEMSDIPVVKILVIVWIIFSVYFIGQTLWFNGIKLTYQKGMQDGANQGYAKAFSDVVTAASNEKCQPFPLNFGQNTEGEPLTIPLINVNCLKQAEGTKTTETTPTTEE